MKILFLNWRDIRSPRAGGAEVVTHEVAARVVRAGHEVVLHASAPDGLPEEETLDGVRIVRRGSEATTRLHAPAVARRERPDVVVEEINTLPYFAPLWSAAPVLLYMNQLAREVWWYEAPRPLAAVGWLAEPAYLQAYRRTNAVTISRSTLVDLRRLGVRAPITIVPMACDCDVVAAPARRELAGRLVSIGRLTPSKRYDHAIEALAALRETHPGASLTLVGDGRDRERLLDRAAELGVEGAVRLTGRVSEAEKIAAIDEADVLVGTSAREGWGLTVTEAAARGVPSVVYDVPGFRDAVVHGRTGLVSTPAPGDLAATVASLLDDRPLYERLAADALAAVPRGGWDATAAGFLSAIDGVANGQGRARRRA